MGKVLPFRNVKKKQEKKSSDELSDRLVRIRASLERINKLMGEIHVNNSDISTRS